jgi:hypothetical protein
MWSRLQVPVPYTRTDHPTRSCSRSELSYNVIPIPRPVMPLQPWVSGAANEAYEIPVHVETRGHELRLPGSLAFVSRQIPDLPPIKMRGSRAAEYNCTGRSVILGVCPRLSQPFAVMIVSTESLHFGGIFGLVNRSRVSPWRGFLSLTLVQRARNQACVDKGSTLRAPRRSTVGAHG